MTKEEILKSALERNEDEFEISSDACSEAMDLYAKQECIAIVKLMWENQMIPNIIPYVTFTDGKSGEYKITPEDIYELLQQSKTTQP